MRLEAILLDMDGTLITNRTPRVSDRASRLLRQTQERGVAIIIASGRALYEIPPELLNGLEPDYFICQNGMHIADAGRCTIYERRFTAEQIEYLTALCDREGFSLRLTFEDAGYLYAGVERYHRFFVEDSWEFTAIDCPARDRHLRSLPYGAALLASEELPELLRADGRDFVAARYLSEAYDICVTTKAEAAELVLARLGVEWSRTAAFGDGENDIAMLRAAGTGVAMGNAPAQVRAAADITAPPADEDGVACAVERLLAETLK